MKDGKLILHFYVFFIILANSKGKYQFISRQNLWGPNFWGQVLQ
jgi:hypothetical protein